MKHQLFLGFFILTSLFLCSYTTQVSSNKGELKDSISKNILFGVKTKIARFKLAVVSGLDGRLIFKYININLINLIKTGKYCKMFACCLAV